LATRFQSVTIVYGVQIIKNETTIAKHIWKESKTVQIQEMQLWFVVLPSIYKEDDILKTCDKFRKLYITKLISTRMYYFCLSIAFETKKNYNQGTRLKQSSVDNLKNHN
jgi:hypothetical protein